MRRASDTFLHILECSILLFAASAHAFESGSTGVDGDLNPPVSTEVVLPPNGVLNYHSVNIPKGVTVTFKKNAMNTPVVMLSQTDIIVSGTISVEPTPGRPTGNAGDGVVADDGQPGKGGPGAFDGGQGGFPWGKTFTKNFEEIPETSGQAGLGPGGGAPGTARQNNNFPDGYQRRNASGGTFSGNPELFPLIGGSGGGGGVGGVAFSRGAGGGGGGGAILLAATGTVQIDGNIAAVGGNAGQTGNIGTDFGGLPGGGSGGAVSIVATRIAGNGSISAGGVGFNPAFHTESGPGRVRIEAEVVVSLPTINAPNSFSSPRPLFAPTGMGLRFVRVGGLSVPLAPTGTGDVTLPANLPNPVAVELQTSQIPVGSPIKVTLTPPTGQKLVVDSAPTTGNLDSASTSVNLDFQPGASVLAASVTFTITASASEAMSRFAQGERVEKVRLEATLGQPSRSVAITHSGREMVLTEQAMMLLAKSMNEP